MITDKHQTDLTPTSS